MSGKLVDASAPKRATNVSLNMSQAYKHGLAAQIAELREKQWLDENRTALASSNSYVEAHGLPLPKQRPY
jgi:antitoxin CcdA